MSSKKWKGPGKYYKRSKSAGWSMRTPTKDSNRKKSKKKRSYTAKQGKKGDGVYAHLHDYESKDMDSLYVDFNKRKVVKRKRKKKK